MMNEFTYLAGVIAKLDDQSDLLALSMRLADMPCGPLYKRHITPEGELATLVATVTD